MADKQNKEDVNKSTEKNVDAYYSSKNTDDAYKTCWGEGNIHFGYFPHLEDKTTPKLPFKQAAETLTARMIAAGGISKGSKVLDMGCGYGKPACAIVANTQAEVWGVDLSEMHIKKAQERAKLHNLEDATNFVVGSFTELPCKTGQFSHIWSQVAWCHAHSELKDVLKEAHRVLATGGRLVVNDFLGSDAKVTEETKEHVYKRLRFTKLLGHEAWKKIVEEAGFKIEVYESLDKHIGHGYAELAKAAKKNGFKSSDGTLLATNYQMSSALAQKGQIGMNFCVARKC